jgi:cyclopropane fatty-acyl-phospholipid synthase-like methyltransferase
MGESPQTLAHPGLLDTIRQILEIKKVQQMSGFWLRRQQGKIDQVDISFPWQPELREFSEILRRLCRDLGASASWLGVYRNHPLRHLAFSTSLDQKPTFTAYFSSGAGEIWPADLKALKRIVLKNGNLERRQMEQKIFSQSPEVVSFRDFSLDEFYSTRYVDLWKRILGNGMHYHAGIFPARQLDGEISDELADRAARRAVEELYPYIPRGARIYDIGCGWSGPLKMITEDLDCHGVGLTVSKTQFLHGRQLGLLVRHGDAEATLPPGRFDCMILIESFCHIKEKRNLLKVMRLYSDRLIMRVNCQDWKENSVNFGGTMPMIRSRQLREMIIQAGWKIIHWRDRRMEAMPSVGVWHRRLQSIPRNGDRHMNILREYTNKVLVNPLSWAIRNPLIEVVAD